MVPQVELFLGELKTPKRHIEINWPLNEMCFFLKEICSWKKSITTANSALVSLSVGELCNC